MSERRHRAMLWFGSLILALITFIPKGHEAPPVGVSPVALVCGKQGTTTVRVTGDLPHPGLYRIATPGTAYMLIRQVLPAWEPTPAGVRLLAHPLADGDLMTITRRTGKEAVFEWSRIPARQRMVLGIPLDPAVMSATDWEALPGIGPALTRRIMIYGSEQGGLHTFDDLYMVKGIGARTMQTLRPLFH